MRLQKYIPAGPLWDRLISVLHFRRRLGYWPALQEPRSFNELLLKRKFKFEDDLNFARRLTDKVAIKDFLRESGFEDYVVPTVGVYSSVDELLESSIEESCVIKPTHSSGYVIVKKLATGMKVVEFDSKEVSEMNGWLNEDYYLRSREPTYRGLSRRLIAERLLLDSDGLIPKDFKFHCWGGRPFMIQVDFDRLGKNSRQLYDQNWNLLPFSMTYERRPDPIERPAGFETALGIATKLAKPFNYVRVDFYLLGLGEVRLGELTFFPGNCALPFAPPSADFELGAYLKRGEIAGWGG